jgi:ABC-type multidrug transport system ATPase subunit
MVFHKKRSIMSKLIIQNLSKTYPNGVKALDNVRLEIENGIFGLLGPNGAGKSSLMRTLACLQEADSGKAFLDDIDIFGEPQRLRKHLGYLPQEFGFYPRITAHQLLTHIAILKGITNSTERKEIVNYLLDKVNIYDKRNLSLKTFSGGMRQRVGIAQALLGNPKLIIVDEPTAGLDPGERNRFYNILSDVSKEVIVILSTHIVEDVSQLCSQMAIMNLGKIVFEGGPQEAINALEGKVYQKVITREELETYAEKYHIISNKMQGGRPVIHIYSDLSVTDGFEPVKQPGLEDVFFSKINTQSILV